MDRCDSCVCVCPLSLCSSWENSPFKLLKHVVIPTTALTNVILTSYFSSFDGATVPIAGAVGILKIYEPFNCVDQEDNHVQTMT